MYVKEDLKWKRREDLELDDIEGICIEIFPQKAKSFYVLTIYRPPDSSKYLNPNFNERFDELLQKVADKECILLGDINVDFLKANVNREFKSILQLNGHQQLISSATRIAEGSETLIDIIASSVSDNIKDCAVIPAGIADHELIGCVRKINHQKFPGRTITCRDYRNYDPENLTRHLNEADWEPFYKSCNVNDALRHMTDILTTAFSAVAPMIKKRVKGKPTPWLTSEIKEIMNNRDKLLRKYRKCKNPHIKEEYKRQRNLVNTMLRKAKNNYTKNLLTENANDPNSFWGAIKRIYPSRSKSTNRETSFVVNGSLTDNRKDIADGFCQFYSHIASSLKKITYPLINFTWRAHATLHPRTYCSFRFQDVSVSDVTRYLKNLKRRKAAGYDNLPPGLLKDAASVIARPLTHLINMSLNSGDFPAGWKIARVQPLYKSGPRDEFGNYRPISILPVISKIVEKVVHKQLTDFLQEHKLLSERRFGFTAKKSTELAVTLLNDDIRRNADNKLLTGCVFLDFSKAFDTLSHSKILSKMPAYGIYGKELDWITSYLFNRQQIVKYSGTSSSMGYVSCGVPQGSILGPLIFIIFVNDIVDCLKRTQIIKYADDTVLYVPGKSIEIIENELSSDLSILAEWFRENELILNLKKGKTEAMIFGTAKRLATINRNMIVKYQNTIINVATYYKYLGVEMDPTLTFQGHFCKAYKKATGRLHLLRKLRPQLDAKAATTIYRSIIVPTLTYCSNLFISTSKTQSDKLVSIHERAVKCINNSDLSIPTIQSIKNRHACKFVKKSLDGNLTNTFNGYFTMQNHLKDTRSNKNLLKLPKVRIEFAKKSIYFAAAKLYNDLPGNIRNPNLSQSAFTELLNSHFV